LLKIASAMLHRLHKDYY